MLTPAACYPVYPLAAARGPLPQAALFDVAADCFRHEPSRALDRLQSFRMREFVRIGSPGGDPGLPRAMDGARARARRASSALPCQVEIANDPFFGRVGQMMAVSQRQQSLKFELLIPYHAGATPTACMSFNYHRDHFGTHLGASRERRRRARAHRLRRLRHRPAGGGAVLRARHRRRTLAGHA